MHDVIVQCLSELYDNDDLRARLETELVKHPLDARFGLLNSAFLDMLVVGGAQPQSGRDRGTGGTRKQMDWFKSLSRELCDMGICAVPAWMNDRSSVKSMQAKIMHLADDLTF